MDNILGCALMIAITFPVSFLVARTCLRGVIRLMTSGSRHPARYHYSGRENRDVV